MAAVHCWGVVWTLVPPESALNYIAILCSASAILAITPTLAILKVCAYFIVEINVVGDVIKHFLIVDTDGVTGRP